MDHQEPKPLERRPQAPITPKRSRVTEGRDQPFASRALLDQRIQKINVQDVDETDELMVLQDLDNGKEYYLSEIDRFSLDGQSYAVMVSFELEQQVDRIPDLVIMQYRLSEDGQQFYTSIRDVEELDRAFGHFYARLDEGLTV